MEYLNAAEINHPIKKKKSNFLKKWIISVVKDSWESDIVKVQKDEIIGLKQLSVESSNSINQPDRAIQFTIYNANGGRVIETRRYDRHKDRHSNGLYVITSDQDFGKEIDKIITMEYLK